MDQSQRVLVAGTGKSGIAAAKLILNRGGEVVLYDGNTALDEKEIKARFEEGAKVNVVLGEIKRSDLLGVELCIISPGIPLDSPFVAVVDDAKIPILGEIELAWRSRTSLSVQRRKAGCHYGNKRKDDHHSFDGSDGKEKI